MHLSHASASAAPMKEHTELLAPQSDVLEWIPCKSLHNVFFLALLLGSRSLSSINRHKHHK